MSSKRKIRFIVNPFSGISSKDNFEVLIQKHLDLDKFDFDYFLTEAPKHATTLAQDAVDKKYYMAIAVGGDGTVNEVAAALVNTETCLGIIPGGSGNGFAMFIGMGRNKVKALEILNQGKAVSIDSCSMNDEFFINLAGVGFDANIAYHIKQSSQRGFKLYFKTVLKQAWRFKAKAYKMNLDDQTVEGAFSIIAVANAAMYGYNFTIAPEAELTDGKFDIITIKKASLFRYILSSWRMINNSLHKSRLVKSYKAKDVQINLNEQDYYHLDGEGHLSPEVMNFKMMESSIKVLFPKSTTVK